MASDYGAVRRVASVPGIGLLTASALVAAVGVGSAFGRGRDLSAWLGLVPRQVSTGGKAKLIGISKRGNCYLRTLFIHGARAVLNRGSGQVGGDDGLGGRAQVARACQRRGCRRCKQACPYRVGRSDEWASVSAERDGPSISRRLPL